MHTLRILLALGPLVASFFRDRKRWLWWGARVSRTPEFHARRARALVSTIAGLGPTFVKLAQVFASRADLIPDPYIGELGTLYQRASAAFVGGTFTPSVGGHSPAEALGSGCPVVHGPYVHSTPGAWDGVAGFVARTPAALASAFDAALQSPRATPKGRPRVRPEARVQCEGRGREN